ncbi:MAG: DUF1343 domain-containing protein [Chlorobiaceae bacterium]|nr:DUF1343 domain-containing protein [Chlorobiaceae bacterium]
MRAVFFLLPDQVKRRELRCSAIFSVLLFLSLLCPFSASGSPLSLGIDRLEASHFSELREKRVGLITNRAGVTGKGEADYITMLRGGVNLLFLMAPEHGFSADIEAGRAVGPSAAAGSLPVHSLYGESKKPDEKLLGSIDILLFDLQDVGTRCYTYISTMKNAMESCGKTGTAFMVLDRPNPVIPLRAEGFMVAPGYGSFVGAVDVPFVHSMTVGEIAIYLKNRFYPHLDLRVIPMQGYSRGLFADEYPDLPFVSPSPNIRNVDTAILYPALVFLEGTSVSEGRGSDAPFRQFGAPFIDSRKLLAEFAAFRLEGVAADTVSFVPASDKFKGAACRGLKLRLTDRKAFSPFRTAAAIMLSLRKLYPEQTGFSEKGAFFDKLAGTPRFREMIVQQKPLDAIMRESSEQVAKFRRLAAVKLLYP